MWHGVPFACQRRPIIGVLRMCWLLLGSFDCFCCPHTSVHRPSIACLAVFLCGPGALFLHALSGPSTICPFPPHGWSAPDGLPLLLRKQPIWAAGDTPPLMPVEQGLPWHLVATGLAGQAIPFIVAASHAHALPSAPFSLFLFFDEAATVLEQYETVLGSKYTLRIYHSFFPCQRQGP